MFSFSKAFSVIFFGLLASKAFAVGELTQSFTLDGQLSAAANDQPLLDSNAKIVIQILDPSKSCLLYEEQQFVDTSASNGYYNIQVGSALGAAKRTASDPGRTMDQIYQNSSVITANSVPGFTCVGGVYTPTAGDSRYFRMIVTPSATGVADTLSPDTTIDSVASALVAQTLQGYSANQFLQTGAGDLTQANLQTVFAAGNSAKLASLLSVNPSNYVTKDATSGATVLSEGNVGIGTTAPDAALNLSGNATQAAPNTGSLLHLTGPNASSVAMTMDAYGNNFWEGPYITTRRAHGTSASPSFPQANDIIGHIQMQGWTAAGTYSDGMFLSASANENWGASARGTRLEVGVGTMGSPSTTVVMRMVSSGISVFYGSNSPTAMLQVGGNRSVASWNTTGTVLATNAFTTTDTTGSGTVATRVANSFGIPTFASTNAVALTNAANVYIAGAPAQGTNTTISNAHALYVAAGNSYFGGNVGIGTTGPSEKLHVVGNLRVQGSTDCTLGNGSGGTNCSSDIRLKTNIREIENPLQKILALRGIEFDWNEKSQSPGQHSLGVIAQEVEGQFPTAVIEDSSTGYKKVDYAVLVAPIIQAFKELFNISQENSKDIASLKADSAMRNATTSRLEAEIAELKKQNESLKEYLCVKDPSAPVCK